MNFGMDYVSEGRWRLLIELRIRYEGCLRGKGKGLRRVLYKVGKLIALLLRLLLRMKVKSVLLMLLNVSQNVILLE
jgi:hypothetical protein